MCGILQQVVHIFTVVLYRVVSFSVQCALHKETDRQLYVSNVTDVQHDLQSVGCRPPNEAFVGEFAKLRNATMSFVMSVRPHGTTFLLLVGFL